LRESASSLSSSNSLTQSQTMSGPQFTTHRVGSPAALHTLESVPFLPLLSSLDSAPPSTRTSTPSSPLGARLGRVTGGQRNAAYCTRGGGRTTRSNSRFSRHFAGKGVVDFPRSPLDGPLLAAKTNPRNRTNERHSLSHADPLSLANRRFFLDIICPFSGKQWNGVRENLIPLIEKDEVVKKHLSVVIRQVRPRLPFLPLFSSLPSRLSSSHTLHTPH
jgi:hypothetical protein